MEYPKRNGMQYDPVEDTQVYKAVIQEIEEELEAMMKDRPAGMGSCHSYWHFKKQLLASRGIQWKSPGECNPYILFD